VRIDLDGRKQKKNSPRTSGKNKIKQKYLEVMEKRRILVALEEYVEKVSEATRI